MIEEHNGEYKPLLGDWDVDLDSEEDSLLGNEFRDVKKKNGLSLFFATLCLIDLFGVFPIVTMPRSIIDCGWLGPPLVICVFALQVYTAILLGRCWIMAERIDPSIKRQSRRPYSALAEMTYGVFPARLVTILLDLTIFAGGVPNLIVAAQNMQLLGEKAAFLKWDLSYCYWMPIIGIALCPIMWLGSPKDMKWLVVSSSCAVVSVSIFTWTSIAGQPVLQTPTIPNPSWESIAIAYGILAFQFDIHPLVLTVQVDMADKMKIGQAVMASFTVTGGLFVITTIMAVMWYGQDAEYNLLRSLPSSDLLDVNALLVTIQICLSTVVGCTALFQDLEYKFRIKKEFNWMRCALRTSLVILSVSLSEIVPRFDLIMSLVGGSMMGPLMFVLPPLFYSRLRAMEPQLDLESVIPEISEDVISLTLGAHTYKTITRKKYYYYDKSIEKVKSPLKEDRNYNYRYEELPVDEDGEFQNKSCIGGFLQRMKNNLHEITTLDDYPRIGPMVVWEKMKTIIIVSAGVMATALSTYYSLSEAINYARYTPPCFINVTAATLAIVD